MIYETDEIKELVKAGVLPQITEENYYSNEINKAYLSFHTWADFHGTLGMPGCEARALATLNGEYSDDEESDAFLIGGYVDAALVGGDGELERFINEHPQMLVTRGDRKGELQAKYAMCQVMIDRAIKDEFFLETLCGEHQAILVCTLFGVPFKCKLDSLIKGKAIVDLKTTREMHKQFYIPDFGRVDFISYYGYVYQLAYYKLAVKKVFGEDLPCFVSAISKSKHPELKVIHVDDLSLFEATTTIQQSLENTSLVDVWQGSVEPIRCGSPDCNFCVDTEVLTEPVNYKDLIMGE